MTPYYQSTLAVAPTQTSGITPAWCKYIVQLAGLKSRESASDDSATQKSSLILRLNLALFLSTYMLKMDPKERRSAGSAGEEEGRARLLRSGIDIVENNSAAVKIRCDFSIVHCGIDTIPTAGNKS